MQSAVLRVEQLSLQLEDLRKGKLNGIQTALGSQVTGAAALELRKLYQELQVPCSRNTPFVEPCCLHPLKFLPLRFVALHRSGTS